MTVCKENQAGEIKTSVCCDSESLSKSIVSIEVGRLLPHPENPNKMSKSNFSKLCRHIEQTGNYEPVVVRKHPLRQGCFEIVNGHHRTEALKTLGFVRVDCVIWDVDDDQVRILLATLNRLGGRDILSKKAALVQKLSEKYEVKQLANLLTDSRKQLEKLKGLKSVSLASKTDQFERENKEQMVAVVFFTNPEQKKVVESAIDTCAHMIGQSQNRETRTSLLVEICESYLDNSKEDC